MIAAVEDVLSEAVLRRLLAVVREDLAPGVAVMGRRGRSFLEQKGRELNRTARSVPVIILADLDRAEPCPADLIKEMLASPPAPNLLFRIAVMEIESWIMADRREFSAFLGVPIHRIPLDTDTVSQPKEFIVGLARKSRRKAIRDDLAPRPGSTAVVGPAFNAQLSAFVSDRWNVKRATESSPSLRRTVERLRVAFL